MSQAHTHHHHHPPHHPHHRNLLRKKLTSRVGEAPPQYRMNSSAEACLCQHCSFLKHHKITPVKTRPSGQCTKAGSRSGSTKTQSTWKGRMLRRRRAKRRQKRDRGNVCFSLFAVFSYSFASFAVCMFCSFSYWLFLTCAQFFNRISVFISFILVCFLLFLLYCFCMFAFWFLCTFPFFCSLSIFRLFSTFAFFALVARPEISARLVRRLRREPTPSERRRTLEERRDQQRMSGAQIIFLSPPHSGNRRAHPLCVVSIDISGHQWHPRRPREHAGTLAASTGSSRVPGAPLMDESR